MIQTKPKSKKKYIFYLIGMIIIFLFVVTIVGLDDLVNKKGQHPIFELFNRLQDFDVKNIIFGFLGFGFFGWIGIGTFILITIVVFLTLSKLDYNLQQIKWTESNYLPDDVRDWLDVSASTFILTVLAVMVGLIIMSFIYAYRY